MDDALQTLQTLFTAALKSGLFSDAETVAKVAQALSYVKALIIDKNERANDTVAKA